MDDGAAEVVQGSARRRAGGIVVSARECGSLIGIVCRMMGESSDIIRH